MEAGFLNEKVSGSEAEGWQLAKLCYYGTGRHALCDTHFVIYSLGLPLRLGISFVVGLWLRDLIRKGSGGNLPPLVYVFKWYHQIKKNMKL